VVEEALEVRAELREANGVVLRDALHEHHDPIEIRVQPRALLTEGFRLAG
jgi:hypothetical protein